MATCINRPKVIISKLRDMHCRHTDWRVRELADESSTCIVLLVMERDRLLKITDPLEKENDWLKRENVRLRQENAYDKKWNSPDVKEN